MRGAVTINLASEPFRRDRPFQLAALAAVTLLAGVLGLQLWLGWMERGARALIQSEIDRTQATLGTLQNEFAQLEATLRRPENAEVIDYTVFLNALILRKGISWTRIFGDLEQVMPHNVRLVAVRPQVNPENQILLDMTVAAQSPEPVIDMLMRLEGSSVFGATAVTSWLPPSQSEPQFRYRVNVNYAPKL